MKKKLLITASTFPRWRGDTEPRFILDYAKAMGKYYDVTVLAPATIGAKHREKLEGVKVIRYHYLPIYKWETLCYPGAIVPRIKEKKARILQVPFLMFALYINLLKLSKKYDVVHAHWLIPQGIMQCFVNRPFIITGHGGDVKFLNHTIIGKLKVRCLKKAKAITVVSKTLEKVIYDLYPNKKTQIIPMGCNTKEFSPKKRVENYFNQGEKKVVLFVGRLEEIKGVEYLIEAMRDIDAYLVIVGKGSMSEHLKVCAKKYKDKIMFLGPKTHEELPRIYASADLFVMPSITAKNGDKEGFGLVAIEAMASGLPIVATDSGGIVDVVSHGNNGLLVEEKNVEQLAENITNVLEDKQLYKELSQASLETAKQFDYNVIARKYKAIMDEIK